MTKDSYAAKDALAHQMLSRPLAEANTMCETSGYRLRVVRIDGQPLITTCDYVPDRINVVIENDIVVDLMGYG